MLIVLVVQEFRPSPPPCRLSQWGWSRHTVSPPQVAKEDGEEDFVGSEGSDTTNYDFESEGVNLSGPTIRKLVGDLDKS